MDRERFFRALGTVLGRDREQGGIGTLGERALHATVKLYIDENPAHHEQKIGRFSVDVWNERGVFEIQTRSFDRLRDKLARLLPEVDVTVVYPITRKKRLSWINPADGSISKKRMSPKTGRPTDVIRELMRIRQFLSDPHFHLRILLVDCDEYKTEGKDGSHKRGAVRFERIPYDICEDLTFSSPADYRRLLPIGLPPTFTSLELARLGRLPRTHASGLLLLLRELGAVRQIGKAGRAFLYEMTDSVCIKQN
jgi:hypothetical protein